MHFNFRGYFKIYYVNFMIFIERHFYVCAKILPFFLPLIRACLMCEHIITGNKTILSNFLICCILLQKKLF